MDRLPKPMRISTRVFIAFGAVFLVMGILVIASVNYHMREQALTEAEEKAEIILEHRLAIHSYFSHDLKPKLFDLTEPVRPADYFEPTWMSSTFAIREIHKHFASRVDEDYYYKECAINARSPKNEADAYESKFIHELNANPDLEKRSIIRMLGGEPYFVTLHRGEAMEADCMRCHSTPAQAPGEMVNLYGPERSFHRKVGDVISAVSIRVPMASAYAKANLITLQLSGLLLSLLILLYGTLFFLNKKLLLEPLSRIRSKAVEISSADRNFGKEIPVPPGRELAELTRAFNTMSVKLRNHLDELEERVRERTSDLTDANERLTDEIRQREKTEREKERLILELKEALASVKTLRGLLPICASCKNVRDDKGYWNQIEEYVRDHSNAEFSHSICPSCAEKLYADYYDDPR